MLCSRSVYTSTHQLIWLMNGNLASHNWVMIIHNQSSPGSSVGVLLWWTPISFFFFFSFWKPLAGVRLTAVGGSDGGSSLTYRKRHTGSCNSDQLDLQRRWTRWPSEPGIRSEKGLINGKSSLMSMFLQQYKHTRIQTYLSKPMI